MTPGIEQFSGMTLSQFSALLASAEPVPGGGSAAAVAASLAASLASMVVRLSQGRPGLEVHAPLHTSALASSEAARHRFLELAQEDAEAYASYREARRMPRTSAAEATARDDATRAAARRSTDVPLATVEACRRQLEQVERLAGRSNPHAASDLDVAALLLAAAARAAAANVLVNLAVVADDAYAAAARATLEDHLAHVEVAAARTRRVVAAGEARGPEPA